MLSDTIYIESEHIICMMVKRKKSGIKALMRSRERLIEALPDLRDILRGGLVEGYRRCGRPNCRCAQQGDPGHGPACYLMVSVGIGRTVRVYVPRDKKDEVERRIDNFRRVRDLLEKISTINRELIKGGRLFEGD